VDDLIDGMIRFMESPADFIGPVNVGNPEESTICELAEKIVRLTNSDSRIQFKGLPDDDPRKRRPDITLAQSKLNWAPTVPLDDGLRRTIGYFEAMNLSATI